MQKLNSLSRKDKKYKPLRTCESYFLLFKNIYVVSVIRFALQRNVPCTVVPATRGHCRFGAKVFPRGRWSLVAGIEILTHVSTETRLLHIIVYALLMHTQTRSESNENREIPSITTLTCTVCTVHGI